MKIFNTPQIRELDAFTIAQEPISSLDLMERASLAFTRWFCEQYVNTRPVAIFCGKGNNGGDGLAIARLLSQKTYHVKVYILNHSQTVTPDFTKNLLRLENHLNPSLIEEGDDFPQIAENVIVIDAILGSGLTRGVEGFLAEMIGKINHLPNNVISVDIASGLFGDQSNVDKQTIIKPTATVAFQFPKLAFMFPQNAEFVGDWHVVNIGLHPQYIQDTTTPYSFSERVDCEKLFKPRDKYAHKGRFGHALLLAGSYGKMGAATLSGRACLRSGVGLLTMHIPAIGYQIMQISIPEAMISVDTDVDYLTKLPDLRPYQAVGIGPGIGTDRSTVQLVEELLVQINAPLVIDADALNLLAENKRLLNDLPRNTILTPHPKEFQRLAGDSANDYERLELARNFAQKYEVIVCLKGANTAVILSNGEVHFNSTGNPGMATGGSGDVLTGIITSLLAQGYKPEDAAILGVYEHGLAGDNAARTRGMTALIASDIVDHLKW